MSHWGDQWSQTGICKSVQIAEELWSGLLESCLKCENPSCPHVTGSPKLPQLTWVGVRTPCSRSWRGPFSSGRLGTFCRFHVRRRLSFLTVFFFFFVVAMGSWPTRISPWVVPSFVLSLCWAHFCTVSWYANLLRLPPFMLTICLLLGPAVLHSLTKGAVCKSLWDSALSTWTVKLVGFSYRRL